MTSPVRAPRPTPRRQPASAKATRPDLRVVGAPVRRVRTGLTVTASAVVVFVALFVAAVAHSLVVTSQVHLDRVGVELRSEQERLQREKLRLATAQSPARITREARRLGMVPADDQNWLAAGGGSGAVVTTPIDPTADASDAPDPSGIDGSGTGTNDGSSTKGSGTDSSGTTSTGSADELASSTAATR